MPAVCRFFLKGYCRYGRNCRFEHPGEDDYANDYTTNNYNQQTSVTNFSFKTSPDNNSYSTFGNTQNYQDNNRFNSTNYQQTYNNSTSGFSFRQPVQSYSNQNNIFNPDDVDMSEGFSFRNQSELGNNFGQNTQNTLLQNNNNLINSNIFGTANLYQQQSFSFNQPNNNFNQQRSPFEQVQSQNIPFNNNSSSFDNNSIEANNILSKESPEVKKKSEFRELNELSQVELEAFKRDKFEFRKIPVRPPAKALC